MLHNMRHEAETDPRLRHYWENLHSNYSRIQTFMDWFAYYPDEAIEHYRNKFERRENLKEYYNQNNDPCP